MEIFVAQFYIVPGVSFPFTHIFQKYLSKTLSELTVPSKTFEKQYGIDWKLIFRMSAKTSLTKNEIRGPTLFDDDKHVEYTVFLPYDEIIRLPHPSRSAVEFLFNGICEVLKSLDICTEKLRNSEEAVIAKILSDSSMVKI